MITIKNINIIDDIDTVIFTTSSGEVEGIDVHIFMDYEVDKDMFNIENWAITEDDIKKETLEGLFPCFISVWFEDNSYMSIDNLTYNDLFYEIVGCDFNAQSLEGLSDAEKQKAFKFIKDNFKSDRFKKHLEYEKECAKKILRLKQQYNKYM